MLGISRVLLEPNAEWSLGTHGEPGVLPKNIGCPACPSARQVWAGVEAGLHRGLASYAMTRFQRNSGVRLGAWINRARAEVSLANPFRKGADRMNNIKEVIKAKLQELVRMSAAFVVSRLSCA